MAFPVPKGESWHDRYVHIRFPSGSSHVPSELVQKSGFPPEADPILRLKGVIGFGGHSTKWALWTPDGAAVVYPCHAVIVVLHIETREQRLFLGHTEKVSALALDGSGSLLASAQAWPHSMLRLWDFQTGSCLALFRSPVHTLCSLSFSSSGELLCGVGKDRHGRTARRSPSPLPAEHEGPITSVRVSPGGLRVLSTTSSGHLGFLDVPSQAYSVLVRSHTAPVLALATERSRGQLATVSQDHTVRVWDLVTLQQLYDFASPEEAPRAVAFHPMQPTFFCGFSSGAVRSFSLEAAEVLVEHRWAPRRACPTDTRGGRLAGVWTPWESPPSAAPGHPVCATPPPQVYIGHSEPVRAVAFTPDQQQLLSVGDAIFLWDILVPREGCPPERQGAPGAPLTCEEANVVCQEACPSSSVLVVSGDSRLLAFVGPSKYTVSVVDAASLDELLRVDVSALDLAGSCLDSAVALCFGSSPPGHLLVSTSSNTIAVLDARSGRVVRELSCGRPAACASLALSADGRFLLTAAERAVRLWDYAVQASPSCQVRPEEQYVAAGYSDGALRIFSIPRTAVELKMYPHSAALTALAFSADGQTIVSGDKDGLVAVSHPCTGMTFRVLSDHRGAPICTLQSTRKECGDFGAEGTDLWLAASGDQRVSVWASDWLRDHCELVDWLSFPAPGLTGVSVLAAPWARCPGRPPCTVPPQAPGCLPPSLAAFCPWNPALLVCAGLGVHPEVVFYSLRQKQARASLHSAGSLRAPGLGRDRSQGQGTPPPEPRACRLQVVEKIPLPFFAVSMSLSPGAHLVAIGFSGECW
ncbi:hypothetical protein Celaphus_00006721 [Cervus elaphus hippelaphus]|uniref:WDR90 n=1 Tax=Cervus elaphus hippelaphus TaxID=46360 RepID=A0A212CZ99_CEREH|nr:hypothetical protein Celaphus_00006721 [Cervus elaphus hippelaphus]